MASSMAGGDESCQQAGGDALQKLARFRRELFWCLWRRPDALFELIDAVLAAGYAGSLPYLSLEPAFRRGHGMVYQALSEGGIDEEALRDLLVAWRPRDWPLVFAIDASAYPRPGAETSPGREWHHHSCPGSHGSDGAAVAGWAFQWLAQVSFAPGSWTAPQDQVRAGAGDDATRQAAEQVIAHSARMRAAGQAGIPLYVLDAGYDEAPLTWDLRGHLDRVQVLVRLRNDRVLYRDPPPRVPGRAGRPRIHGSGSDRFECKNPATWGPPGQELAVDDEKYGHVRVMSWDGLQPEAVLPRPVRSLQQAAGDQVPPRPRHRHPAAEWPRRPRPAVAVVGRPGRPGPGPDLAGIPSPVRYRAHLPVRQARPRLGQGRAAPSRAGRPLDLAHHLRDHPAAPGPAGR